MNTEQSLEQTIAELKQWQETHLLKKTYSACSPLELRLALDNLESKLSPECICDDYFQTGRNPETLRQAIRALWLRIEEEYRVVKPMTHKW